MPRRQGYYHITVLTKAAQIYAGLSSRVIAAANSPEDPRAVAYLLGCGTHRQAVVKEKGKWILRDRTTCSLARDLPALLRHRSYHGMAMTLLKSDGSADMDTDAKVGLRSDSKRPRESTSDDPLMITNGPCTPLRDDRTAGKRCREKQKGTNGRMDHVQPWTYHYHARLLQQDVQMSAPQLQLHKQQPTKCCDPLDAALCGQARSRVSEHPRHAGGSGIRG